MIRTQHKKRTHLFSSVQKSSLGHIFIYRISESSAPVPEQILTLDLTVGLMGNAFASVGGSLYFGKGGASPSYVVRAEEVDEDDEFDDPVERMLKKTGCLEKHYSVQECIAETKDWRQCQKHVQDFRDCMDKYKNKKSVAK